MTACVQLLMFCCSYAADAIAACPWLSLSPSQCLTCVLLRVVASLKELRREELGASSSISSASPVATLALPHQCLAVSLACAAAACAVAAISAAPAQCPGDTLLQRYVAEHS